MSSTIKKKVYILWSTNNWGKGEQITNHKKCVKRGWGHAIKRIKRSLNKTKHTPWKPNNHDGSVVREMKWHRQTKTRSSSATTKKVKAVTYSFYTRLRLQTKVIKQWLIVLNVIQYLLMCYYPGERGFKFPYCLYIYHW